MLVGTMLVGGLGVLLTKSMTEQLAKQPPVMREDALLNMLVGRLGVKQEQSQLQVSSRRRDETTQRLHSFQTTSTPNPESYIDIALRKTTRSLILNVLSKCIVLVPVVWKSLNGSCKLPGGPPFMCYYYYDLLYYYYHPYCIYYYSYHDYYFHYYCYHYKYDLSIPSTQFGSQELRGRKMARKIRLLTWASGQNHCTILQDLAYYTTTTTTTTNNNNNHTHTHNNNPSSSVTRTTQCLGRCDPRLRAIFRSLMRTEPPL